MIPDDFDEFAMAKLAREMAMNIRNYQLIFDDFGITEEDFYEISKNEFFKRAKEQFAIEWNSTLSATDRTRLIHAAYAEELSPIMGQAVLDDTKPLSDRLDVYKQFCKSAGLGEPKAGPGANERFVISINIGGDTQKFDKSIAIDPNDIAPEKLEHKEINNEPRTRSRTLELQPVKRQPGESDQAEKR
jgi:hypothetical protein